jgi:hypothetical protein
MRFLPTRYDIGILAEFNQIYHYRAHKVSINRVSKAGSFASIAYLNDVQRICCVGLFEVAKLGLEAISSMHMAHRYSCGVSILEPANSHISAGHAPLSSRSRCWIEAEPPKPLHGRRLHPQASVLNQDWHATFYDSMPPGGDIEINVASGIRSSRLVPGY